MATATSPEEKFSCSVCLDLFTEPATIPCGHSFCLDCIGSYWDLSDQTGVYSCPQCRETFTPRPVLRKSNVLNELVEELKKTRRLDSKREPPAPAPVSAELGDVPCDFCPSEIKRGAVRSCLTCRGSYCEAHLQPHYETAGLKRHALVQPLRDLEQKLCKQHQRLLELYCRTDQSCICMTCALKDHQNHAAILAEEGRSEKQNELRERQVEIENLIEERLIELERLNQAVESLKLSAHKERAESEQVLSELIRSIERIRTEVGELIGAKEKAAVSRANEQREQLEQEIQELRKKKAEMEQLSETEDHIHFLQSFQSVCTPPTAQQLFDNIDDSFWTLREAVSRLKDDLEGFWKVELMKATIAVDVTLDRDTAHSYLILSEDGKQVRCGDKPQPLPDNPKRFDKKSYVLGREGFTSGRHYWEVEVGEKIRWVLGVTRESSQRKGGITEKPQQGFWVIWWNEENNLFSAVRAPRTPLPLSPKPRKLGVYLDYEGGHLSFYNVETRSHIYTFTDTFTEKLYPLFSPGLYSSGKNAAPLIICPHTYTD
ncbi:E3 ubiquitin-protein ligase TRIM39-like isoform X1 [Acipenser ruthenus]|nr:E3 ubiquitin-protein ligase TRIM39-like isoform X1 [Acipenser ruthenus]XP_058871749.1 E3 ubiquitin-protein ligase TRIM39-like isoform X1 [Acipenser ruthenus]XP_058871750.1 E3 ubiquitin-protein ligase TRIM39-like isoform X1 [Acipenser ruthenus]